MLLVLSFISVLTCPQLEAPNNGYFVNNRCKSVLNAACGLRCKQGFDLQGSGLRICREDGTWSGTDTQCISKINFTFYSNFLKSNLFKRMLSYCTI